MPVDLGVGGGGSVSVNRDWPYLRCFYCKLVDYVVRSLGDINFFGVSLIGKFIRDEV